MFGVKGFGSVGTPRKYQYVPRFWDPDKDAWEKKKEAYRARGLDYGDEDGYKPGNLVRRRRLHREIEGEKNTAGRMTIIIRVVSFCLLAVIVCLLFKFFF